MRASVVFLLTTAALVSATFPDQVDSNSETDPQQRSFSVSDVPIIGSLFGGEKEEPEIPHLGKHPLWKVHRYHGISLQPIHIPKDEYLTSPPVPPTLPEEPPSIVNVPDHHFVPEEHDLIPHNEYEKTPPVSAPYPPASAPYPPASAPYPPASAPYPPASAPYPPSQPSAPYPSAHSVVVEHPHAPTDDHSHILQALSSFGNTGDFQSILNFLPADMAHRLQEYMSTPEGKERASSLIGIATNAHKLKSGAARSLVDVFQRLFGGVGGSNNIAIQSGTYTKVPEPYPAHQGFFQRLHAFGTGVSGSPLPDLPEAPELPKIPGLGSLPPVPGLPHINLPATNHVSAHGNGKYVSINLPQPHETSHTYIIPENHHEHIEPPAPIYGAPTQPRVTAQAFSLPAAPAPEYSAPAQPSQTYQIPSTSYGTPSGPIYPYHQGAFPVSSAHQDTLQTTQVHYGQGYDSSIAASENHEDHVEQKEVDDSEDSKEVSTTPPMHYRTKLHRVQDKTRLYRGYARPSPFRPSLKDKSQPEESVVEEEPEE